MARRFVSLPFFGATPVFDRGEYARAVGRDPHDRIVTAMLAHHLRSGNIRRISRGVFRSVPKNVRPENQALDRLVAASKLRSGGVIAYHSALELQGCAKTEGCEIQVIAPGDPGIFKTADFVCRFVSPPCRLPPTEGVMSVDCQGLAIKATSLERTIIDLLDRHKLAGGAEELFDCLDLVAELSRGVDIDAMVSFAEKLGNGAAAGVLGYWLECERDRLDVPDSTLQQLRMLAPGRPRYALGAKPGQGRAATGWNVILPDQIVERYFDS